MTTVLEQLYPANGQWLAVGLVCPGGPGACAPDLVLGGAVRQQGQWRVRLLARYYTALYGAPDPCHAQLSDSIVPNEKVVIVGCFNGGSDLESFVVVLSMRPGLGLPQVLLDADCGDTEWQVRGARS